MGYISFVNYFRNNILNKAKKAFPSNKEKESNAVYKYITSTYNDTLIIVDEAHKLRGKDGNNILIEYLQLIAK